MLSFGEAAGVLKQDINKACVKSRGPLMPSLTPRTAVSVLTFRNEKDALPRSVPRHASQKRILRVTRNAFTPKNAKTKGRES